MKSINVDSSVHEADLITAAQAARLLGVRKETLYAYVSRGLLRSYGTARSKGRSYLIDDVRRLKSKSAARAGHTAVAANAMEWGAPILDSSITAIGTRGPIYRGYAAVDLARDGAPFENVAELLWSGELPTGDVTWSPRAPRGRSRAHTSPLMTAHPLDVFPRMWSDVARAARDDEGRHDLSPTREHERARALIAWLGTLGQDVTGASFAARLASALTLEPTARVTHALDAMLVLIADHELNPSTFAARVAASTGADLYACIVAALAAASGPRHGAAAARIEALVDSIGHPDRARDHVTALVRRGDTVPGFGHPLYADGDPRATPLLSLAASIAPRARTVRILDGVCHAMEKTTRMRPNVDLGLVALAEAIGAPRGTASAAFVLGRTAGWVAHVIEQRALGFVLRPRARYTGVPPILQPSDGSRASRTSTSGDKK